MAYSGGTGIPGPPPVYLGGSPQGVSRGGGRGGPRFLGGSPQGVTSRPRPPKPPGVKPPKPPGSPPPPSLDPRDATYYMNVGQNQFDTNNRINALNLQGAQAGTGLQAALAQLAYQQPRDSLRLEQQANARGALYSTPFQQQEGDLSNNFLQRQGADITGFQQGVAGRAAQVSALEGGEGLYALQQALAASLRASQRAARNPAQGESNAPFGRPPGSGGTGIPGGHPGGHGGRGGRGRRPPGSGGVGIPTGGRGSGGRSRTYPPGTGIINGAG